MSRGVLRGVLAGVMALGAPVWAQSSVKLTEPPVQLLPEGFDGWKRSGTASAPPADAFSLANVSKQALEEAGPQRSLVESYGRGGRTMRVEAIEFGDRTGAYSAFTLAARPGMKPGTDLGAASAVGGNAVLFTEGDTLVLASPASEQDVPAMRELVKALPKVTGSQGMAPLLPGFVPAEHLVPLSLRYALGPATYAAEGGVLPANSLDWEKSGEVATALYDVKGGRETLTLLVYPTPQIAQAMERRLNSVVQGLGPSFATARVRRENELVMVASGGLSAADAQKMLDGVHMRQDVAVDRYMPPVFHAEVQKTFSLLENIAILSGVLMGSAVLLGLFLGGGRALIRVLRGKPAAAEAEFLSLHLAPQNPRPRFDSQDQGARS